MEKTYLLTNEAWGDNVEVTLQDVKNQAEIFEIDPGKITVVGRNGKSCIVSHDEIIAIEKVMNTYCMNFECTRNDPFSKVVTWAKFEEETPSKYIEEEPDYIADIQGDHPDYFLYGYGNDEKKLKKMMLKEMRNCGFTISEEVIKNL